MSAPKCSCDTYGKSGLRNVCSTAGELSIQIEQFRAENENQAVQIKGLSADLYEAIKELDLKRIELEAAAELSADVTTIGQQRDELLNALNAMLTHMGMDEDEWNKVTFDQASAAVAKVAR